MKFSNLKFSLLFLLIIVSSVVFFSKPAFAYDDTIVHPSLTGEMADLYNHNYTSDKLSDSEIKSMRKGSTDEDARQGILLRSANHFYNPFGIKKWVINSTVIDNSIADPELTTKEWMHDSVEQDYFPGGDFTWERAIWDYANGEKERAYEALGHILHLMEDMAVPAHTRNDLHIAIGEEHLVSIKDLSNYEEIKRILQEDGEPYETWNGEAAKNGSLKLSFAESLYKAGKKPIIQPTIDGYLDDMAIYANTKFFSKDTIYAYSMPNNSIIEGSELLQNGKMGEYVYRLGENGNKIKLAKISYENPKRQKLFVLTDITPEIHSDYWSHLAPRAVLTGAGVIKLFKEEAEKAAQNPQSIERPKSVASTYGFLAPKVIAADQVVRQATIGRQFIVGATIYYAKGEIIKVGHNIKSLIVLVYNYGKTQVVAVIGIAKSVVAFTYNIAESAFTVVYNDIAFVGDVVSDFGKSIAVVIYDIAKSVANSAKSFVVRTSNDIVANATLMKNNVSDFLQRTADSVSSGIAKTQKDFSDSLSSMISTATVNILNIFDAVKNIGNSNNLAASVVPAPGNDQTTGDSGNGMNISIDKDLFTVDYSKNEYIVSLLDTLSVAASNANSKVVLNDNSDVSVQLADSQNNNEVVVSIAEISETDAIKILEAVQSLENQDSNQSANKQPVTPLDISEDIQSQIAASRSKTCSFVTSQIPTRQKIIMNEVAWMGGSESYSLTSNDEWIELKNISTETVDISDWQMLDKDEQIKIKFGNNVKINPNGFYLLERTDDSSVPNMIADNIYSGALSNSNEGLRLFDSQCNLADEALASPNWPAGDATTKRTMERESGGSTSLTTGLPWRTFSGNAVDRIFGSPRGENSVPAVNSLSTGGGGASAPQTDTNGNQQIKILINEVQISPIENRFIELYNPNNSSVDLTGWYIQRKTKTGADFGSLVSKTYFEGKTIGANGYFLISRGALNNADIVLDDLTLTESNTIQIKNSNGDVIDKLGWGEAVGCENNCAPEPLAGRSIQRKFNPESVEGAGPEPAEGFIDTDDNADDFEIRSCPSPKAQSRTCEEEESNETPVALFDFMPANPTTNDLISFNAGSSTDPDGDIVSYEWNFGNGDTAVATETITNYSYPLPGDYQITLTVLDDKNLSSAKTSPISIKKGGTNHVVISEIQAGTDAGSDDEFIELYNPTNRTIDLDGWELRKKTSSGSESNLVDDGGFSGSIDPKGFFLITNKNYKGSKTQDLFYSTNSNIAYSDNSIILYNGDYKIAEIVDEISYVDVPKNKSFERKAFSGDQCISAGGAGEYSGNACDTDNSADFEIRETPNPQNSESLPEPREVKTNLSADNWIISYDPSKVLINFGWPEGDSLTYEIKEYENDIPVSIYKDSASNFSKTIDEVGRRYKFSIRASDKEGMAGNLIEKEIEVQSFIKDVAFYNSNHKYLNEERTNNIVEFSYDDYPFLPQDLFYAPNTGPNYKTAVFYLNENAPKREFLDNTSPSAEDADKILRVEYKNCSSGSSSLIYSLTLPDSSEQCNMWIGGFANNAMTYDLYLKEGDKHLLLPVEAANGKTTFGADDYFTVAFYGYSPINGSSSNFKLFAVDKNRYKFQESNPFHEKPSIPGNMRFSLDREKSVLKTAWDKSSDPDTLDNFLKHEISYDGLSWKTVYNFFDEKIVEPGADYAVKVRATDDFGLVSDEAVGSFSVPSDISPLFGISDLKWGRIDDSPEIKLSFNYQNYPFMPDSGNDNYFDMMMFYLNDLPPLNYEYSALAMNYTDPNADNRYPRLMTDHKGCIYGNESKSFSALVLPKSTDYVSLPGNCLSWSENVQNSALTPVPPANEAGAISLPVTNLAKSGKTLNDLTAADYITVGFYNIEQGATVVSAGNDTRKYFFREE